MSPTTPLSRRRFLAIGAAGAAFTALAAGHIALLNGSGSGPESERPFVRTAGAVLNGLFVIAILAGGLPGGALVASPTSAMPSRIKGTITSRITRISVSAAAVLLREGSQPNIRL